MVNRGERAQSQISGLRKDDFIRCLLREISDLDEATSVQIASHLSNAISVIKADREVIERYKTATFDPNAFSAMKVYRTSGEDGLRQRLDEIRESRNLQALAKAQQISLPRKLRGKDADLSALKNAIVNGLLKRYEDWQAAS